MKFCRVPLPVAGAVPGAGHAGGLWKTIDDETKTGEVAGAHQRDRGVLGAKIEKVFDPSKQDDAATSARRTQGPSWSWA